MPADAELVPWARWITPEPVPIRFDTRFYLALAPPHSPPRPDGGEVDALKDRRFSSARVSPRRGQGN